MISQLPLTRIFYKYEYAGLIYFVVYTVIVVFEGNRFASRPRRTGALHGQRNPFYPQICGLVDSWTKRDSLHGEWEVRSGGKSCCERYRKDIHARRIGEARRALHDLRTAYVRLEEEDNGLDAETAGMSVSLELIHQVLRKSEDMRTAQGSDAEYHLHVSACLKSLLELRGLYERRVREAEKLGVLLRNEREKRCEAEHEIVQSSLRFAQIVANVSKDRDRWREESMTYFKALLKSPATLDGELKEATMTRVIQRAEVLERICRNTFGEALVETLVEAEMNGAQ